MILVAEQTTTRVLSGHVTSNTPLQSLHGLDEQSERPDPNNQFVIFGLMGRVFANGPGDLGSILGHVMTKTFKMVLDTSLLKTLQYKRYVSRVK